MGRPMAHNLASAGFQVLGDRKSTRLNSSHVEISYAVFCLKKKQQQDGQHQDEQSRPSTGSSGGDEHGGASREGQERPRRGVKRSRAPAPPPPLPCPATTYA